MPLLVEDKAGRHTPYILNIQLPSTKQDKPWNATGYWRGVRVNRHTYPYSHITYDIPRKMDHLPRDRWEWERTASVTQSESKWPPILMRVWDHGSFTKLEFEPQAGWARAIQYEFVRRSFAKEFKNPNDKSLRQDALRRHTTGEDIGFDSGFIAMTSNFNRMRMYAQCLHYGNRLDPTVRYGDVFITFIATAGFKDTRWKLLRLAEEHEHYKVMPQLTNGAPVPNLQHWLEERKTTILALESVPKDAILLTLTWNQLQATNYDKLKERLAKKLGWKGDPLLGNLETLWIDD
jgi:hypothetical protein